MQKDTKNGTKNKYENNLNSKWKYIVSGIILLLIIGVGLFIYNYQ